MWPCGTVVLHAIKGVQQNKTRQWHLVKGHSNFVGSSTSLMMVWLKLYVYIILNDVLYNIITHFINNILPCIVRIDQSNCRIDG